MRIASVVLVALALSCRPAAAPGPVGRTPETRSDSMILPPIAGVLERHSGELMRIPGVVGTGEGVRDGRVVFVVFVVRATPELERKLPRALEGHPVEIRESGEVTAPPGRR